MADLKYRQEKIINKRKNTSFRDFVMEITSWFSVMFYKREGFISKYPETTRVGNILDNEDYIKHYNNIVDKSSSDYGSDPFMEQFKNLFLHFQFPATYQFFGCENSRFGDVIHESKNVYLSFFVTTGSENVMYSLSVKQSSSNIVSSFFVSKNAENVYNSSFVISSSNIFYSQNINNCSNIWFSKNLTGCSECIGCNNLVNQSYCIDNKQFSKEEYSQAKNNCLKNKGEFDAKYRALDKIPVENHNSINYSGNYIIQSENVHNSLYVYNLKDSNNAVLMASDIGAYNIYDSFFGGSGETYDLYGSVGAGLCNNLYCSIQCGTCTQMYYSMYCESCSFCLGCVGLKNKSFCILNKEYSKEEWHAKVDEIFAQMDADGTLGAFFPSNMNPFYFNDTAAYLIDPSFSKEEAIAKGFLRRDEAIKVDIPNDAEIIKYSELDAFESFDAMGNWLISAEVLKKVIQDEQGNYYRIIPMEYKFLMKYGLPLPRKHWLERMKENFRLN